MDIALEWHGISGLMKILLILIIPLFIGFFIGKKLRNKMKFFWMWRRDFMVNNPNNSSIIAFLKGIIVTILSYEYF